MAKVDISIVAYKNYKKIINCVESILSNTDLSILGYIYIVDNTECEYQNEYLNCISKLKQFKNVKYIKMEKNRGFGAANNVALKESKNDYFAIVNPDILLTQETFSKIINFMSRDKTIGAVIPKLLDGNGKRIDAYRRELTIWDLLIRYTHRYIKVSKRYDYHIMKDKDFNKPFNVPFAQGSFLVVDTNYLKKIEGFDERYFMYVEDADISKKINEFKRLVYFPSVSVIHFWQKGSHSNAKLMLVHLSSMIKYFAKWGIKWK